MTTERLFALAGISEKIFAFYSEKGYHYDAIGEGRIDPRLKSVEAMILAQDIWEGRAKQEDWGQQFGEIIPTI